MAASQDDAEWIAVRANVSEVAADALGSFLIDHGATAIIGDATDDADPAPAGTTRLEAHIPAACHAELAAALPAQLERLRAAFPGIVVEITTSPAPTIDWDAAFRQHHRPVTVGRRLLVVPPWEVPASSDREVLVIEPGMAFGTGQHATTRGCLEEIEAAVQELSVDSALDVGTGSGLLAAAMSRLGVPHVVAIDNDPAVLPLARENLKRNAASRVSVVGGSANAISGPYDLVVANLLLDVIVGAAADLAARVAPGGRLVLSGLLVSQTDAALAAFPGWRLAATRDEAPWRTLRLVRAS